jgi:hypothetical protein
VFVVCVLNKKCDTSICAHCNHYPRRLVINSPARKAFLLPNQRSVLPNASTTLVKSIEVLSVSKSSSDQCISTTLIQSLRGGSTATKEGEVSDSEYDDEYGSEEDDEYDEETDDDDDEAKTTSLAASIQTKVTDQPYDALLTPPPMQQMLISISIMLLSQKIDIFTPRVVTIARATFVGYIIAVQLFLLYVRMRVKQINDRTEITISNPLASLVQGMQQNSKNAMVKSLTSQILTTQTTVYEYDLQQIKSMQSSLLMPMVFIYFLHFKMKQMQPLLMQIATGLTNLVYSPLWQVYILGRRLERPFGTGNIRTEEVMGGEGDEKNTGLDDVVIETEESVTNANNDNGNNGEEGDEVCEEIDSSDESEESE